MNNWKHLARYIALYGKPVVTLTICCMVVIGCSQSRPDETRDAGRATLAGAVVVSHSENPVCDCENMNSGATEQAANRSGLMEYYDKDIRVGSPLVGMHFVDHRGDIITGEDLIGKPVALSFIYTRCENQSRCPLVTNKLQHLYLSLEESGLAERINVALITFDPLYDTPEQLSSYGVAYGIDVDNGFMLLQPQADSLRRYLESINFPVNYEQSGRPNIHGTLLLLLDKHGRIAYRYDVLIPDTSTLIQDLITLVAEN